MANTPYELYYWPSIQGRGEFIRLALEQAAAPYIDVARQPGGVRALQKFMSDASAGLRPFAPPILKAGELVVSQTAVILHFLAPRHGLISDDEPSRLRAHQLQLTLSDFLGEVHDTHHPISSGLYYEDQKEAALLRASHFRKERAPKFLDYFEGVLARNGGLHLVGTALSYVDLSMFQVMAGLAYAFPKTLARLHERTQRLRALHEQVAALPRIAAYLASPRRIPFNENGIFRRYPELDAA